MGNLILFPNVGIGPVVIDAVAFNLFGRDVMWYGLIVTSAIIVGVMYVLLQAKKERMLEDDVLDYALIVVSFAILCARLYYVVFDPTPDYKNIIDVLAIWEGGLAIYGGIIGGAIAVFVVCKWKKVYFARFADMICPAVMIGQAIGRWGNFVNGEAYGSIQKFDFLFWSFDISESAVTSPFLMVINGVTAQPTFLYESLWNAVGFILIVTIVNKKRLFAGMTALFYFAWYGFGRMFIEGLRTDSLYIPGSDTMRVSQLIGFFTFVFSLSALIWLGVRSRGKSFDIKEPVYYGRRLEILIEKGMLSVCDEDKSKDGSEVDECDMGSESETNVLVESNDQSNEMNIQKEQGKGE